MDAEQIQQQMRIRRAAIDAKLDRLEAAVHTAGRRGATTVLIAVSVSLLAVWLVRRRFARRRERRPTEALRLARVS
jgi:hypothetical protein